MPEGQKMMTLGSLFDGSGGFPLGGILAGIHPVWASEIEPFPIRVTTKRLPGMKHYGDIRSLDGGNLEPVDIITFGSPCQDMSLAGSRAGLKGSRSCLFHEAVRIIREMRCATDGRYPRYIVWENVAGAFSSSGGRDFQSVLTEIVRIKEPEAAEVPLPAKDGWPYADILLGDGWSIAYRLMDSQGWGVPQRRRRIYLVADFGGRSAGKVLFDTESVFGDSASCFRSWQGTADRAADCTHAAGRTLVLNDQGGQRMDVTEGVTNTLRAESHHPPLVFENHAQDSRYRGPLSVIPTISQTYGAGGNNQPLVMNGAQPFGISAYRSHAMLSDNPKAGVYEAETARTLDQSGGNPACHQGGTAIVSTVDVRLTSEGTRNARQNVYETETARTIDTGGNAPESNQGGVAVVEKRAEPVYAMTTGCFTQVTKDRSPTIAARDYKDPNAVQCGYAVRRLTPTECARLQGFPDWWCSNLETENPTEKEMEFWREVFEIHRKIIGTAKKPKSDNQIRKWLADPHKDSAEYRMWGNGITLPIVFYVLSGIVYFSRQEELLYT